MVKIGIIAVFVTILILSAAIFYYANHLTDSKAIIDSYNVRKEDVYSSQQRIEQSLAELNQTLQAEIEYSKSLINQITVLYQKANESPPVMNITKTIQSPPVVVAVPSTVSRPVTRAS